MLGYYCIKCGEQNECGCKVCIGKSKKKKEPFVDGHICVKCGNVMTVTDCIKKEIELILNRQ